MKYLYIFIFFNAALAMNSCDNCINTVDFVREEIKRGDKIVGPLLEFIRFICHSIYGPAARQCFDITSNATQFIEYIINHNSTYICHQAKIC